MPSTKSSKRTRRPLERTRTPGIFRRHVEGCGGSGCKCSYVVTWKDHRGKPRKQSFPTLELAREHKGKVTSGLGSRQPLSAATVGTYYGRWLPNYRGRTSRGLEDSTRREYRVSFEHHILPFPIAHERLRDLTAGAVRDWLLELERKGRSPETIRRAKVALSVMLACAVEDDDLIVNPAAAVRYVPTPASQRQHAKRKRHRLVAADVVAILRALPVEWRAFFTLLVQSGVRVGELLGLTWEHVHLGDDPHIMIAEQVYRGERKRLKTEASEARVPLSSSTASWLSELRPADAQPTMPVFPSRTGSPLTYANIYNRVLRPALVDAGLAVKVGEKTVKVRKRGRTIEETRPVWDYQGIAFHAFRKACGSLLLAHGKREQQVQGWLRHSQLSTTMNVYIHEADDGLGSADVWDEILGPRGNLAATEDPETAAKAGSLDTAETVVPSQIH